MREKKPQTAVTSRVFFIYAPILSAYFPNMAKYRPRILHIHFQTFRVFSEYGEIVENTQNEFFTVEKIKWGP
jgi:hypothetical protein